MIRLLLRWLNSATATVVAVITRIVAVAVLIIPNLHHRRMDKILAIAKRCAVHNAIWSQRRRSMALSGAIIIYAVKQLIVWIE